MTCHDARERFSEWVDDALPPDERAAVAAHLETCADCRRELDRVSGTVALLRRMERPRAPVGFVDRVLEAARPTPWPARLLRRVFVPLRVKLPAEAAALLLVAGLAVYVFQGTPELQQSARQETPRAAPTAERERPLTEAAVQKEAGRAAATAEVPRESGAPAPQARADELTARRGAALADKSQPAAPAPSSKQLFREQRPSSPGQRPSPTEQPASEESRDASDAKTERFAQSGQAPPSPDPAPIPKVFEAKERNAIERGAPRSEQESAPAAAPPASAAATPALPSPPAPSAPSALSAPAPAAPPAASPPPASELARGDLAKPPAEGDRMRLAAKRALPPADVVGLLAVKDRESAERTLGEILARSGGTLVSRREEGGATVLDVVVPQAAAQSFADELARVGSWSPVAPPTSSLAPRSAAAARSEAGPLIHFTLRLVQ
jgi:Putative zinc-finger